MWLNGKPSFISCALTEVLAVSVSGLWGAVSADRSCYVCRRKEEEGSNNLDLFSVCPDPHSGICKSRFCFRLFFLPSFSFYEGLQSNRDTSLAVSLFQGTFLLLPCSEMSLCPFFGICATSCHFPPGVFCVFVSFFCLSSPFLYSVVPSFHTCLFSASCLPASSILKCLSSPTN